MCQDQLICLSGGRLEEAEIRGKERSNYTPVVLGGGISCLQNFRACKTIGPEHCYENFELYGSGHQ